MGPDMGEGRGRTTSRCAMSVAAAVPRSSSSHLTRALKKGRSGGQGESPVSMISHLRPPTSVVSSAVNPFISVVECEEK